MYETMFELHAELLKALAHPRRLEIIRLLRDKPLCVSDIYEMLDLPQANISQHLMVLRDAGIVTCEREGKQVIYRLADANIVKATDLLRNVLIERHRGSELAEHLALSMQELTPVVHDPVCGMRLSPCTANFSADFHGRQFYFCASGCLKKFKTKPEAYVN